nr:neurobeachin [Hymenolepis microstoma]CUU97658.1 neurobeachin [Hymenolepis microstoma]
MSTMMEILCRLLFNTLRFKSGGWRVWIGTLAILHSRISFEESRRASHQQAPNEVYDMLALLLLILNSGCSVITKVISNVISHPATNENKKEKEVPNESRFQKDPKIKPMVSQVRKPSASSKNVRKWTENSKTKNTNKLPHFQKEEMKESDNLDYFCKIC